MKRRNTEYVSSDLICSECGNTFPIVRPKARKRETYHLKKLYCIICKKETNHIEVFDKGLQEAYLEFKEQRTTKQEDIYQLIKKRRLQENECNYSRKTEE